MPGKKTDFWGVDRLWLAKIAMPAIRRGLIPVKTLSAPSDYMELVLVLPPQQEGFMSRFVVRFLKDVLGENGREAEICQGSLQIDASDEVDATERAKRKFCETQALRHWSLHADRIQVSASDSQS